MSTSMCYKALIHKPRVHKDSEVGHKVFRCEEGYFLLRGTELLEPCPLHHTKSALSCPQNIRHLDRGRLGNPS